MIDSLVLDNQQDLTKTITSNSPQKPQKEEKKN